MAPAGAWCRVYTACHASESDSETYAVCKAGVQGKYAGVVLHFFFHVDKAGGGKPAPSKRLAHLTILSSCG